MCRQCSIAREFYGACHVSGTTSLAQRESLDLSLQKIEPQVKNILYSIEGIISFRRRTFQIPFGVPLFDIMDAANGVEATHENGIKSRYKIYLVSRFV